MLQRCRRILLNLSCVLLLAGCNSVELSPLPADSRILAFGDSLTAGVGTSKDNSYPAVLQSLTGLEVINAGVSGEETDAGLQRLPGLLDRHQPQLVILMEGGNDILRGRPYPQIQQNLSAMIELVQARSIPLVLVGVPEKKLFAGTAPFYQQLAEHYSLVYAPDLISDMMLDRSLKSDLVHFNQQGYRQLAEGLQQLLQQTGAL
ncbi:arylesterase [Bacterioplanoides pacificum]|uniref:Arylesterase n=1 Tax=Bacterioplanoides pacificum TaxID=1171596 RepID=A0ABV7VWZ5_9GAMM